MKKTKAEIERAFERAREAGMWPPEEWHIRVAKLLGIEVEKDLPTHLSAIGGFVASDVRHPDPTRYMDAFRLELKPCSGVDEEDAGRLIAAMVNAYNNTKAPA